MITNTNLALTSKIQTCHYGLQGPVFPDPVLLTWTRTLHNFLPDPTSAYLHLLFPLPGLLSSYLIILMGCFSGQRSPYHEEKGIKKTSHEKNDIKYET